MDKLLLPTSIVGAGVCLLFSMSAVVVLGCYKERSRPLMIKQQFSVSLVFTYIVILSSLEGFRSEVGCRIVSVLAHYGIIASFLWILCDIYHVSICIKRKNFPPSFLKIFALIWGLPLIFVISAIIIGLTVNQTFRQRSKFYKCWKTDHVIWTLAIPCIFAISASAYVLFTSTHMVFKKKKNSLASKAKSSLQAIKYSIKTNMVMLLLTTIVWIFGCQMFWYNTEVKYHLVFGLAAGIQGLFLFFFYCVFCLEHDLYVNEKSFSEFSVNFEEPAIKRRGSEFRRMSVATQMKDKNPSNHIDDIIEEKEDEKLRPRVDDDVTQHNEPNSKLLSATSNRDNSISGSTKALIHSPETKAPHVMQVSESPDSLPNDKPNEEIAVVGNDNSTVEKTNTTNLSSADPQHGINRKSDYKDDLQPLPDHDTSKQSSDSLQDARDKPSQTSNLSKNVSYAGSGFSLGNTKSPPMARNLSVASILSRTSQTSYASNMGLNELESLFNNPDLFKQKTIPRGMRPSTHLLTQSLITNQSTAKTTNQNKTQTAIDEVLESKSLEITEKAPPAVDTEQKCIDNTSDIIANINADTEKV